MIGIPLMRPYWAASIVSARLFHLTANATHESVLGRRSGIPSLRSLGLSRQAVDLGGRSLWIPS